MLKSAIKRLVQFVAEDYWNGWLYVFEPDPAMPPGGELQCAAIEDMDQIRSSRCQQLQRQAWKREDDAWVFGAWLDRELVAVCWFQARETYRRHGGLFRLRPDEAELVQITVDANYRGRRIATSLIEYAAWRMGQDGFRKLYAKIWHDNVPSIRAFERAGWKLQARFFSLRVRHAKSPLVLRFRSWQPSSEPA